MQKEESNGTKRQRRQGAKGPRQTRDLTAHATAAGSAVKKRSLLQLDDRQSQEEQEIVFEPVTSACEQHTVVDFLACSSAASLRTTHSITAAQVVTCQVQRRTASHSTCCTFRLSALFSFAIFVLLNDDGICLGAAASIPSLCYRPC